MAQVETPTGVRLINCLGEPVYVHSGHRLLALPEGPVPELAVVGRDPVKVNVFLSDSPKDHAVLHFYRSVDALGTLGLPPRVDGVWYLVELNTLRNFPERTDFVTPSTWEFLPAHATEETGPMGPHVLVGVTRSTAADVSLNLDGVLPDFDKD
jgi:hypothetical protein